MIGGLGPTGSTLLSRYSVVRPAADDAVVAPLENEPTDAPAVAAGGGEPRVGGHGTPYGKVARMSKRKFGWR